MKSRLKIATPNITRTAVQNINSAYLDRRVVGSFMTMTSVMSPYLVKYSLRLSETISQFDYFFLGATRRIVSRWYINIAA